MDRGSLGYVWWNQLGAFRKMDGLAVGRWFDNNILREVGNGTLFCTYMWKGKVALCERLKRLLELEENKEVLVVYMYNLGWILGGDGWK